LKLDPDNAETWHDIGKAYQAIGKYTEALRWFEMITNEHDEYVEYVKVLNSKGVVHRLLGDYRKAMNCGRQVLKISPNNTAACYNMGRVYAELGEELEALEFFNKVIAYKDDFMLPAYYRMGLAYEARGEYESARESYREALKIDANYIRALYHKGLMHLALGEDKHAGDSFGLLLEIKPEDSDAKSDKELLKSLKERAKSSKELVDKVLKAVKSFDAVLGTNPKDSDALFGKAEKLRKLGQFRQAIKFYKKFLAVKSYNSKAWHLKGLVHARLAEFDAAIQCLENSLVLDPKNLQVLYHKGLALMSRGKYEEAKECFDRVLAINAENSDVKSLKDDELKDDELKDVVRKAVVCKKVSIAIKNFNVLLKKNPKKRQTLFQMLREFCELGQFRLAIEYCKKIQELPESTSKGTGKDTGMWFIEGLAYEGLGKDEKALTCFNQVLKLKSTHIKALDHKGCVLHRLGKPGEASLWFGRVLKINPNHVKAMYHKGLALKARGKHKVLQPGVKRQYDRRAIECFDKVIRCCEQELKANVKDSEAQEHKSLALKELMQCLKAGPWVLLSIAHRGNWRVVNILIENKLVTEKYLTFAVPMKDGSDFGACSALFYLVYNNQGNIITKLRQNKVISEDVLQKEIEKVNKLKAKELKAKELKEKDLKKEQQSRAKKAEVTPENLKQLCLKKDEQEKIQQLILAKKNEIGSPYKKFPVSMIGSSGGKQKVSGKQKVALGKAFYVELYGDKPDGFVERKWKQYKKNNPISEGKTTARQEYVNGFIQAIKNEINSSGKEIERRCKKEHVELFKMFKIKLYDLYTILFSEPRLSEEEFKSQIKVHLEEKYTSVRMELFSLQGKDNKNITETGSLILSSTSKNNFTLLAALLDNERGLLSQDNFFRSSYTLNGTKLHIKRVNQKAIEKLFSKLTLGISALEMALVESQKKIEQDELALKNSQVTKNKKLLLSKLKKLKFLVRYVKFEVEYQENDKKNDQKDGQNNSAGRYVISYKFKDDLGKKLKLGRKLKGKYPKERDKLLEEIEDACKLDISRLTRKIVVNEFPGIDEQELHDSKIFVIESSELDLSLVIRIGKKSKLTKEFHRDLQKKFEKSIRKKLSEFEFRDSIQSPIDMSQEEKSKYKIETSSSNTLLEEHGEKHNSRSKLIIIRPNERKLLKKVQKFVRLLQKMSQPLNVAGIPEEIDLIIRKNACWIILNKLHDCFKQFSSSSDCLKLFDEISRDSLNDRPWMQEKNREWNNGSCYSTESMMNEARSMGEFETQILGLIKLECNKAVNFVTIFDDDVPFGIHFQDIQREKKNSDDLNSGLDGLPTQRIKKLLEKLSELDSKRTIFKKESKQNQVMYSRAVEAILVQIRVQLYQMKSINSSGSYAARACASTIPSIDSLIKKTGSKITSSGKKDEKTSASKNTDKVKIDSKNGDKNRPSLKKTIRKITWCLESTTPPNYWLSFYFGEFQGLKDPAKGTKRDNPTQQKDLMPSLTEDDQPQGSEDEVQQKGSSYPIPNPMLWVDKDAERLLSGEDESKTEKLTQPIIHQPSLTNGPKFNRFFDKAKCAKLFYMFKYDEEHKTKESESRVIEESSGVISQVKLFPGS